MRHIFRSLSSKLLASYLLLIIIPVSLIAFFSYDYSKNIISEQISKSNSHVVGQIETNVRQLLDQIIAIINIYNIDTELSTIVRTSYPSQSYEMYKARSEVERRMLNYSFPFNWLSLQSVIIGSNGIVYNPYEQLTFTAENITNFSWYQEAARNIDRVYWIDFHKSFTNAQSNDGYFSAVKFLEDKYTQKVSGVLLLSIQEKDLYNIYKDALNSYNQIFIVNDQGRIVSHSDRAKVGTFIDPSYTGLLTETMDSTILRDGEQIVIHQKIDNMDWHVIEVIPTSSVLGEIEKLRWKIILFTLLGIVSSVFFAFWFSRKLSLPIFQLSKRVHHYIEDSKPSPKDEIDILTSGYEGMVYKLEKTVSRLVHYQEEKRKAELKALQMQINPHFLYNTLSSIKCLVWVKKIDLIEPTINALVHLLENTVDRADELISLQEEFELVKHYVFIHQIRTDQAIEISYQIDDTLLQAKVPKLILQPIIENAIFHGIEPMGQQGKIVLSCRHLDHHIEIAIHDNGIGIGPEQIQRDERGRYQFSGLGLNNVDERLKIYYGKGYGVTIQSEPGQGTTVVVKLPKLN